MAKTRARLTKTEKTALACALLFLVLLIAALLINYVRRGELSARTRALQAEIERLTLEKEQNDGLLNDLNSKSFADAYAREQLDLKRKDEQIFEGAE